MDIGGGSKAKRRRAAAAAQEWAVPPQRWRGPPQSAERHDEIDAALLAVKDHARWHRHAASLGMEFDTGDPRNIQRVIDHVSETVAFEARIRKKVAMSKPDTVAGSQGTFRLESPSNPHVVFWSMSGTHMDSLTPASGDLAALLIRILWAHNAWREP